jgi:hypothetical protein
MIRSCRKSQLRLHGSRGINNMTSVILPDKYSIGLFLSVEAVHRHRTNMEQHKSNVGSIYLVPAFYFWESMTWSTLYLKSSYIANPASETNSNEGRIYLRLPCYYRFRCRLCGPRLSTWLSTLRRGPACVLWSGLRLRFRKVL